MSVHYLGADAVLAGVDGEAELDVGLDGVVAVVLEVVGAELLAEADAAALVAAEVDEDAAAGLVDELHRQVQLVAAVAAGGAEDVAGQALGMDPHQDVLAVADSNATEVGPDNDRQVSEVAPRRTCRCRGARWPCAEPAAGVDSPRAAERARHRRWPPRHGWRRQPRRHGDATPQHLRWGEEIKRTSQQHKIKLENALVKSCKSATAYGPAKNENSEQELHKNENFQLEFSSRQNGKERDRRTAVGQGHDFSVGATRRNGDRGDGVGEAEKPDLSMETRWAAWRPSLRNFPMAAAEGGGAGGRAAAAASDQTVQCEIHQVATLINKYAKAATSRLMSEPSTPRLRDVACVRACVRHALMAAWLGALAGAAVSHRPRAHEMNILTSIGHGSVGLQQLRDHQHIQVIF
uniref:Uncharacterized protein n=1 Tax=Oryza nivara TaxID=4536 RepID=A0A0E0HFK6_ORYNI